MLYIEAVNWVGQKKVDENDHVKLMAIKTFADYIKVKCKGYTVNEIRKALKYGLSNDTTQGGHIYAQRLIFWLKNYDQNERPKIQRNRQPKKKLKALEKPKRTNKQIIDYQFSQWEKGLIWQPLLAWKAIKKEKINRQYFTYEEELEFAKQAAENLYKKSLTGLDRIYHRNIKTEKKQFEEEGIIGNQIAAEASRLVVTRIFEIMKFEKE